jgi:hypothetical protein
MAMKTIKKIIGAGAAVATLGILGTYAFAQQGPGFGPGRMGMGPGMMKGMGPGMKGEVADPAARLATLKGELGIRSEQTAAWDAYARVVTDTAAGMRVHREHMTRDTMQKMDTKAREEFAANMQKQVTDSQAKVKVAAEELLTKLDDAQKAKARDSLPGLVAAGPGQGMRHGAMGAGKGMGTPWMR